MAPRTPSAARHCILAGTALAILASVALWKAPVHAAGPLDQLGTSLNFVPEDVAFYSAMLRNGEQLEAIRKSRALAAIMALPAVQDGLNRFQAEIESGQYAPQVKAFWENPEVQNALKLLADMVSHEVFVCGDDGMIDLIELVRRVSNKVQFSAQLDELQGKLSEKEPAGVLAAALADEIALLKVPNVVLGFQLKNPQLAVEELAKLEALVNAMVMFIPQLSGKWKRAAVAGSEYLTLTLDGGMIPWDELPLEQWREQELREGDVDKVVDRVKKLKKVIALGVRGNYLILAVGPSTDFLARLGKGRSLADRPEFRPLEKFASRRLVSLSYTSSTFSRLQNPWRDIQDMLKAIGDALPDLGLSPDRQAAIRNDIKELSADLNADASGGATSAFHFLTERGVEGYSYFWGKHSYPPAPAALTLLDHIGGKPILAVLARSGSAEASYDVAVKWAKRAYHYFEEFALPEMEADEREQFQKAVELFTPLVHRLDKANRLLIQAFAEGQYALVLDAKFQSRQFQRDLPAFDEPMPMIEPAVVLGVSDANRVREAMREYRAIFNESVESLRKVIPEPDAIPPIQLPEPEATETADGTLFTYKLPEDWGVAEEIGLHLGLSNRVAVIAFTMDHAKRLLARTPAGVGGVLADAQRPRVAATAFDWAGLVARATPWVELAIREIVKQEPAAPEMPKAKRKSKQANAKQDGEKRQHEQKAVAERPNPQKPQPPAATVLDQVRVVLKVLTALPSITSETYLDRGAVVSHSFMEIRDLD